MTWPNRSRSLLLWCLAIVLGTVPFFSLQNHTHWYKVGWIPFVTPPVRIGDILLNVAIYIPMGFLQRRRATRARTVVTATACGLALSFFCETTQLYSHGRYPSSTDLVCNGLGALVGSWIAWARRPRELRRDR